MSSNPSFHPGNDAEANVPRQPLGTLIFRKGLLSAEQLIEALEEGNRTERRLGEILVEKGWLSEDELARALAAQHGLPAMEIVPEDVRVEPLDALDPDVAERLGAVVLRHDDGVPVVAVSDPSDSAAIAELGVILGTHPRLVVTAPRRLADVLQHSSAMPALRLAGIDSSSEAGGAAEAQTVAQAEPEPHEEDFQVEIPEPSSLKVDPAATDEPEPVVAGVPAQMETDERVDDLAFEVSGSVEPPAEAAPPESDADDFLDWSHAFVHVAPTEEPSASAEDVVEAQQEPPSTAGPAPAAEPVPAFEPEPAEPPASDGVESVVTGPAFGFEAAPWQPVEAPEGPPVAEPAPEQVVGWTTAFEAASSAGSEDAQDAGDADAAAADRGQPAEETEEPADADGSFDVAPWPEELAAREQGATPEPAADGEPESVGDVLEPVEPVAGPGATSAAPAAVEQPVALVLRLNTGEVVELGRFESAAAGRARASEIFEQLLTDEQNGWTAIDGRYFRPDAILSVDVAPLG